MKHSEVLKNAKKKIEHPDNWIQNSFCKDKNGTDLKPLSKIAVSHCLDNAIFSALYDTGKYEGGVFSGTYLHPCIAYVYDGIKLTLGYPIVDTIQSFNDNANTDHKTIMAVLDNAIKLAQLDEENES